MIAAYNRQPEMVGLLLGAGASVDAPDASGNTPLMGVCFKGYDGVAVQLLEHGADPNTRNNAGATPLMMAVMFNQPGIARELLQRGAAPGATDVRGQTALSLARVNALDDMIALLETAGNQEA
jgi:ankyrin repeat protein